ncbi:cation:proton antiporter domain-containing protein [Porphyrobacter sp. LM 6]|uniref:cation:proton antiporter domain-containing protein n=1 Tax=Porphyrobacter sp. LM 6 TaxID=1896196 RepID=UPI0008479E6C|nr:cation:proton antiporter [Porphyrobacter sp. LM 6]AOL93319.1 Kef-type potassium/proton antiporter, CPA2 family [Porphyrobacter sp. LM 6]
MADAHSVVATIQPAITLLGLGIGAALVARSVRLNPIVGYLGLGLGLSGLGMADAFNGPLVAAMAEAGVMFLLFNLGLHFSLGRIRAEAGNIFGFGTLQMVVAGGAFAALLAAFGLPVTFAVIAGFGLGLSSTAVVIGLVRERGQEDCPVGRAAQSILIFQDIAAIMLLVAAGALASGGAMLPALGLAGAKALAAFGVAVLFARFLTEPLFAMIARAGTTEVYTATALFIALAAGWATGMAGLSLTLGAFLGGMAVADSRYRILVQTEIDAFRGLFLSFFFISVGLSIDPAMLVEDWLLVTGLSLAVIALKCGFNVVAALLNRWSVPGSIQLGFLLGQGSEFTLVLLALPAVAGLVEARLVSALITAIAISLAVTPFVSNIGRKLAGRLRAGPPDAKLAGDDAPVLIIGMTPAGRAVADALAFNGIGYLALEPDHDRFQIALADGYHVHRANPADPRSWDAIGMERRAVLVVATGQIEASRELTPLARERLPQIARVIAVPGADAIEEFSALGMLPVDMSVSGGAERLTDLVFSALGRQRELPVPGLARDDALPRAA